MAYNNLVSRTEVQALINEQVSNIMLNDLQNDSAVLQMFTRLNVPTNQTRFPVLSALPTAYFVSGDTGLKQTTEANWDSKYINIEELAAIVPIPDSVLSDSSFDLVGNITPLLRNAIARALDAAVFFDTNAPASWPDGVVPAAVAAGNVYARGTNAASAGGIAEDVNQLIATLEADGYAPTGFLSNITMRARFRSARGTDGQPLMDVQGGVNNIWGVPTVYPMAGQWPTGTNAAELVALQRENFVVGVRQDFTVTMHTEGVITDAGGLVIYNLMQQDMSAVRIVFRVGWTVSNPINYQQVTEGSRYPAAVLRSPAP
jgi:HK97 family phage major capsid protein